MNISRKPILLVALLTFVLFGNGKASPPAVPDHFFKSPLVSWQPDNRFSYLFAQQAEDSTKPQTPPSLKGKSPYMAIFYAFVPGVIAHGSGHFYGGETKTGLFLLGAEVAGACLVVVSGLAGFATSETGEHDLNAEIGAFAGLTLFVGSWVYDVVGSPLVVKKQKRDLLERKQGQLRFQRKDGDFRLELVWRF